MAKIKMQPLDAETVTLDACFADYMAKCKARNLSAKTLEIYELRFSVFQKYLNGSELNPSELNLNVIDGFILYLHSRGCNDITVQSYIRDIRAFFYYLMNNGFTPEYKIKLPKADKKIKETYTDEALELMRDNCSELRDLAMIDLLASTGMRVGEMVLLNREDINFNERSCIVFGKGSSEREVYFDARTKIHLWQYLNSRTDDDPALFVSLRAPHKRLEIGGVEFLIRKLGRIAAIENVHPHRFRRTLATRAIDKGMPIEQVQRLLGHKKIDTTMCYALVNQSNVKIAHRRYVG